MKKIIFVLALSFVFICGCIGVKTLSTGMENESFLEFIGNPIVYSKRLDVNIDDKTFFKAEVNKDHADRPKGNVYAISTGTHFLIITYKSKVIYKQQIFISAQETKQIKLP